MKTYADMTVYNRHIVSGAEAYQRTQIKGVEWENKKAVNVIRSGLLEADSVVVYVPLARGKDHINSKAWQALSTKTGKWTIQVGDYLVKGLVVDEITSSFSMSALKAKYDDVVQITSVDTYDFGSSRLRYWLIGAK